MTNTPSGRDRPVLIAEILVSSECLCRPKAKPGQSPPSSGWANTYRVASKPQGSLLDEVIAFAKNGRPTNQKDVWGMDRGPSRVCVGVSK